MLEKNRKLLYIYYTRLNSIRSLFFYRCFVFLLFFFLLDHLINSYIIRKWFIDNVSFLSVFLSFSFHKCRNLYLIYHERNEMVKRRSQKFNFSKQICWMVFPFRKEYLLNKLKGISFNDNTPINFGNWSLLRLQISWISNLKSCKLNGFCNFFVDNLCKY